MSNLQHDFAFDPSYGYDREGLLAVEPPPEPTGFAAFWTARYEMALRINPRPVLSPSGLTRAGIRIYDLDYGSTDGFPIHGWLLEPEGGPIRRGFVVGHGYGGIEQPDFALPCADAVYLVPCFRGLCRSARPPISSDPYWHVLHDIHLRDRYILGGCVEDLWIGVSALLQLHPQLRGRIGYMGISFGGGIGALALPWDSRIARGHLNVPTFGHQPLRLQLPTTGSGASVQAFARRHVHVAETLAYYDAAVAARYIRQPMHLALARFDPAVAPPGQFAVYNALPGPKELFVLTAGHFEHPGSAAEDRELLSELRGFFSCDEPRIPPLVQPALGP
ncbi:MAG: acetylxylan esterase [Chromatiaceae bacterium]|nr:acetylxylan esterase [Chromatiaceae bacterium]